MPTIIITYIVTSRKQEWRHIYKSIFLSSTETVKDYVTNNHFSIVQLLTIVLMQETIFMVNHGSYYAEKCNNLVQSGMIG